MIIEINKDTKGGFMFIKNTKRTCVLAFLLLILVAFTGCGTKGELFDTPKPTIRITSYTGVDPVDGEDPELAAFQQTIYWAAESERGTIKGIAYRVLDKDGNPISTPGNVYIDEYGDVTPNTLQEQLGVGWVLHYLDGANKSIPLDDPRSERTIWSDQVYATINFPANINGVLAEVPSSFEVVAVDNRGQISDPARRKFLSKSIEPSLQITSSAGSLNDNEIGRGLRVLYLKNDAILDDVIVVSPWYFEYQLLEVKLPRDVVIDGHSDLSAERIEELGLWDKFLVPENIIGEPSVWFTTNGQAKINETILTTNTNPALPINVSNNVRSSATVISATVVDMAGVRSKASHVLFYVSDRYSPKVLFYPSHTYTYNEQYHYFLDQDNLNNDTPPSFYTAQGLRFSGTLTSTPIFDETGDFSSFEWAVVGNAQTRFWFRWGYYGEFDSDDPNDVWRGIVKDATNGTNYYSEVSYFHIQLNGKPYPFGPLQLPGMQPDPDWLRIPANHEISQRLSFNGLTSTNGINGSDTHEFTVMIEDLQSVKSEPVTFKFRVMEPTTFAQREGILYICNHTQLVTGLFDFYRDVFPPGIPVTYVNRERLKANYDLSEFRQYNIRINQQTFPYSLLQQYKYVFYTVDSGHTSASSEISKDYDAFILYMRNEGQTFLIGNADTATQVGKFPALRHPRFLQEFFGFPDNSADVQPLETGILPYNNKYYFVGADPNTNISGLPVLNAEIENNPDRFRDIYVERGGLGNIAYFNRLGVDATPLYFLRSKDVKVGDEWSPQSEDERNLYHGKVVAFRKNSGIATGYTFSFPLFHMKKDEVRVLLAELLK